MANDPDTPNPTKGDNMNETKTTNEANQTPAPATEAPAAQPDATPGGGGASQDIDPAALIVGPEDVARMTRQSRKQVYRWHTFGQMPRPVKLPGRGTGKRPRLCWLRADVAGWIEAGFPNRQRWEEMQRERR